MTTHDDTSESIGNQSYWSHIPVSHGILSTLQKPAKMSEKEDSPLKFNVENVLLREIFFKDNCD